MNPTPLFPVTQTIQRFLKVLGVQTTGYRPKVLMTDVSLGLINGVDYVLWGYTFAAMIFTGVLAGHLPLAIRVVMISGVVIAFIVAVTSAVPVHIAGIEEQAVAILATVAALITAQQSEFEGPGAAAATMFVIMALSTLLLGLCFLAAARLNLGHVVQLMPFPVVCGFLAGTGWLFFSAAVQMLTGLEVDVFDVGAILTFDQLIRWAPALVCGLAIYATMRIKDHFLVLPGMLLACALGFYALAFANGMSMDSLREGAWLFSLDLTAGAERLGGLTFGSVNVRFIGAVLPELGTILLISLLSASFSLSALEMGAGTPMNLANELRSHGAANLASGLGLGLPGISDVASSVMYQRMGATSRVVPLTSAAVCLFAAFQSGGFIEYLPKLMMGALIFLAAVHFVSDWLIAACRHMNRVDALTVWMIFGVIVAVGFIPGVILGIIWTSFIFIVRFSKIDVVGSSYWLDELHSSVERSSSERRFLEQFGKDARIFNLRGFIFFGSANIVRERVQAICTDERPLSYLVFDFKRVFGIDSTAAQVFVKLIALLDSKGIQPVFCGMNQSVADAFGVANVFEKADRLVLNDLDLALKWVEERLLVEKHHTGGPGDIHEILGDILGDRQAGERLVGIMDRLVLNKGDYLFHQGDAETSIYLIGSGTIEVRLEHPDGRTRRLREFRQGSTLGEMASHIDVLQRTASAVAMEPSVVYRLDPDRIPAMGDHALEYDLLVHELIARQLAVRLRFMNERTQADL